MKTAQEIKFNQLPDVTIDPSLNEFQGRTPFPKKLAMANEHLKGVKIPVRKPRK